MGFDYTDGQDGSDFGFWLVGWGKIGMDEGDEWGFWIPACAGMTIVGAE